MSGLLVIPTSTPKAIEKHLAKLVSKHSPSCYGILLAELTDTSSFHIQWLDLIFRTNVASHVLQAAEEDSLLFTKEQRLHLDSTVLFGSGLNHLDRLCEGDSNLLPALESFRDYELSQGMQNHSIMRMLMLMRTVILRSSKIETFFFAKLAQKYQHHRRVKG